MFFFGYRSRDFGWGGLFCLWVCFECYWLLNLFVMVLMLIIEGILFLCKNIEYCVSLELESGVTIIVLGASVTRVKYLMLIFLLNLCVCVWGCKIFVIVFVVSDDIYCFCLCGGLNVFWMLNMFIFGFFGFDI